MLDTCASYVGFVVLEYIYLYELHLYIFNLDLFIYIFVLQESSVHRGYQQPQSERVCVSECERV